MIVQTLARLSSTGSVTNRIRGKRLRHPSCLLIENASDQHLAFPLASWPRRCRCKLATNRK
jgi:hypothetical protein